MTFISRLPNSSLISNNFIKELQQLEEGRIMVGFMIKGLLREGWRSSVPKEKGY